MVADKHVFLVHHFNLVAISLLMESGERANDGEEQDAHTGEKQVERARYGTKSSEDDDDEYFSWSLKDVHLATNRQGVTSEAATAPP